MRKRVFAYYQTPDARTASVSGSAAESLEASKCVLTDLSPTVIEIADCEGAIKVDASAASRFLSLVKDTDIEISPLVQNHLFDKSIAHWSLMSPTAQKRMVADILVELRKDPRYSGIAIDIERTRPSDMSNYTEFIRRLAEALHPESYKVFAVVGPKNKDMSATKWVQAFDYVELGKYADYVVLMTYNLHWRTGDPGPVAPLDWVRSCAQYAAWCMPAEKVIVGIPLYGFDWPPAKDGVAVKHRQVSALIERVKPEIRWVEEYATPWFRYVEKGEVHDVWYEDLRSVQAKLDVCRQLGVGGVAIWRLGDEDPKVWDIIGKYSRGE